MILSEHIAQCQQWLKAYGDLRIVKFDSEIGPCSLAPVTFAMQCADGRILTEKDRILLQDTVDSFNVESVVQEWELLKPALRDAWKTKQAFVDMQVANHQHRIELLKAFETGQPVIMI